MDGGLVSRCFLLSPETFNAVDFFILFISSLIRFGNTNLPLPPRVLIIFYRYIEKCTSKYRKYPET